MGPNSCPTIQIQGQPSDGNPSGIVVINESDFDAETMTLATPAPEAPEAPAPEAPAPEAPAAPEATPAKSGKKVVAPWAA